MNTMLPTTVGELIVVDESSCICRHGPVAHAQGIGEDKWYTEPGYATYNKAPHTVSRFGCYANLPVGLVHKHHTKCTWKQRQIFVISMFIIITAENNVWCSWEEYILVSHH